MFTKFALKSTDFIYMYIHTFNDLVINNSYVQETDHRKQSNLRILFLTKMQPKKT